jgi:outer membrane protein W
MILAISLPSFAQFNEHTFGLSINVVYTTSAEIFLNPNSSDVVVRNRSFPVEDILNPGIDFRYKLSESFLIGLNAEYISKTVTAPNLTAFIGSQIITLNVEDGFNVVPIELTLHYYFPFSTENFKFLMGGGLGYYHGEFVRKFSDVELSIVERKIAIGIHVSASMDYMLLENFSFRFEMKFRDPQYNVKSRYTKTEVIYEGEVILLPEDTFETKVNINGITFVLGAVLHL